MAYQNNRFGPNALPPYALTTTLTILRSCEGVWIHIKIKVGCFFISSKAEMKGCAQENRHHRLGIKNCVGKNSGKKVLLCDPSRTGT